MKLTIGMIVKNEEKYLERCLNGIMPILDNVDCELIITDTGSTDRTAEIAKKYTRNILHFDWCDDFSAARNFGLKEAKGEWFMYLDADDIFEDCGEIVEFFNSGEYKKYNSASYTSHNLVGDGTSYVDYRAPRLTKIKPGTRFEGIIHEHLNTFGEPLKNIYNNAVHYGYLHETEASRKKKFDRDSELLLKALMEKGDSDPIIYAQLAECFMGYDRNRAFEFIDTGIRVCEERRHFLITVMYSLKAYALYTESAYKDALKICAEYFDIDKSIKQCVTAVDAEIYAIKASSLYELKRYEEACTAYKYFFVIFTEIRTGKIHTSDMYAAQFYMATESNCMRFMCNFIKCGISTGNYEGTLSFLINYPPKTYPYKDEELAELVDLEAKLISKTGKKYMEYCLNGLDDRGEEMLRKAVARNSQKSVGKRTRLTIGMIVKNEEKYLERCLNGLKPILDNVDSELIITDTGSTDRTVEIAERFTDKIIHFEWIKDFSAARNTAFQLASGEWFMFLDADEIFESCDGIIHFFNSGDYQKYKSASFVIRNLYNEKDFLDFYPRRMVKKFPDTKFVGMIHEYLYPILPPSKHINDVALHYGYLYTSLEETQAKFNRNIEIMLKTLEEEKDPHPRIYSQLFDGYGSVYNLDEAYKYLEIGIEKCKKNNDRYIVVLLNQKADQLYRSGKYDETYSVCEEYFSEKKRMKLPPLTTDGEIYAYAADSLFALGRCDGAISYYKKFFETYKEIKSGRLRTEDAHQITFAMCSECAFMGIFKNFIGCCIKSDRYNTADNYIKTIPFYKYPYDHDKVKEFVELELLVAKKFSYKNIFEYYKKLSDQGKSDFRTSLLKEVFRTEDRTQVINALTELAYKDIDNDSALEAGRIIDNAMQLRAEKKYKECVSEIKQAASIYDQIAPIALKYCTDVVDEYERSIKNDPRKEIQKLAVSVKNNIRSQISAGNIVVAKKTLNELKQLTPEDDEIYELEILIKQKGGDDV